jgi:predicted site-specific integrase-resolvase
MKLLTARQWATAHGVGQRTTYKWVKTGRLPVVFETKQVIRIPADAPKIGPVKPD